MINNIDGWRFVRYSTGWVALSIITDNSPVELVAYLDSTKLIICGITEYADGCDSVTLTLNIINKLVELEIVEAVNAKLKLEPEAIEL